MSECIDAASGGKGENCAPSSSGSAEAMLDRASDHSDSSPPPADDGSPLGGVNDLAEEMGDNLLRPLLLAQIADTLSALKSLLMAGAQISIHTPSRRRAKPQTAAHLQSGPADREKEQAVARTLLTAILASPIHLDGEHPRTVHDFVFGQPRNPKIESAAHRCGIAFHRSIRRGVFANQVRENSLFLHPPLIASNLLPGASWDQHDFKVLLLALEGATWGQGFLDGYRPYGVLLPLSLVRRLSREEDVTAWVS